jgi:hypothetical protein
MTVAHRSSDELVIVEILCEARSQCDLAGTRISKSATRPLGAIGDPKTTCFIEVGSSKLSVKEINGILVSQEGPGGTSCATQIISAINFKDKTYNTRSFSNSKEGAFCQAQRDEKIEYSAADTTLPLKSMRCEALEFIPSVWQP